MDLEQLRQRYGLAYPGLLTFASVSGTVAVMVSSTMVNVAIPSIMGAYGVEQSLAQWVATGFFAAMVASQLLNSWVIDTLGERVTFCLMLAIFTAGAFIAALSPSIEILVIGRIMQGVGAGIVVPLAMSAVISVFPKERRGFALGLYSMGTLVSPGFGPFIGGIAIDTFSWRVMFLVPLPLIGIAFVMGVLLMPHRRINWSMRNFNWSGYILVVIAIGCIMGGIGNGLRWGWASNQTLIVFFIGLMATVSFVVSQLYVKSPLLDPKLFLDPQFASAALLSFVFGAGSFATNYCIPVMMQAVQGFTPTLAGATLIPAGIMMVALSPVAGWIADRLPNHIPIVFGCLLFAVSMYVLARADVNTGFWMIAFMVMISRGGQTIVKPNMGRAALAAVPQSKINQGVGTYNFIRQLGGGFGINIIVVIIESRTAFHSYALAETQTSGNATTTAFLENVKKLLGESGVSSTILNSGALDYLSKVIYAQAHTMGFQDAYMVLAAGFLVMLIPAWILRHTNKRFPGETEKLAPQSP